MLVLGLALIGGGIGVLAGLWRELGGLRPWLAAAVRRSPRQVNSPAVPRALGRATVPHQPPPQSDE